MKNISTTRRQSGAVSLFVVIFAMLIITVMTISFLRLMMADQRQASDNDLSQSAYDSALAGVEDAKRALINYQKTCSDDPAGCATAAQKISGADGQGVACNQALEGVSGDGSTNEIPVQQTLTSADKALNQAYTCVKIALETKDYVGNLYANDSQLVPLFVDTDETFDHVNIEWFSKEDLPVADGGAVLDLAQLGGGGRPLVQQGLWLNNRPSLLKTQLIQFSDNFTLANFDTVDGAKTNGATMFLYPTSQAGINNLPFTDYDFRKTDPADNPNPKDGGITPTAVSCTTTINEGGYACSASLALPEPIGTSGITQRRAYLRLSALYNPAHFRVTLWNGPVDLTNASISPVKFKDVQPEVDSTGRANDLFRRVVSRVDLFDTSFPYPEATINVTGNFCKDFAVTNDKYMAGSCTP